MSDATRTPGAPPKPAATRTARSSLRAAVIGAGKISDEHLAFLAAHPAIELAGICDLSEVVACFARDRFGAAAAYTDHHRMLAEQSPDVVHVLTPPSTHTAIARDCMDAGAHVIVEKPIALDRATFREMWAYAEKCGVTIVENQNYRFNAPIRAALSLFEQGVLGDVTDVEVRLALSIRGAGGRYADPNLPAPSHRLPAGVIHEFITHLSYLTLMFTGGFDDVSATWSNLEPGDTLFKYDDLDALIVRGSAHARIRFTCRTWPDEFTVAVRGTRGSVVADIFQPHVHVERPRWCGAKLSPIANRFANGASRLRSSWSLFWDKILQRTPYEGLDRLLENSYRAFREGTPPPVGHDEIDAAIALVDAMLESAS